MDGVITRVQACLNGRRGRDEHPALLVPGEPVAGNADPVRLALGMLDATAETRSG